MKRSDAETLQEYYQRINDIIDDRNRLQHENALMREQLGLSKNMVNATIIHPECTRYSNRGMVFDRYHNYRQVLYGDVREKGDKVMILFDDINRLIEEDE